MLKWIIWIYCDLWPINLQNEIRWPLQIELRQAVCDLNETQKDNRPHFDGVFVILKLFLSYRENKYYLELQNLFKVLRAGRRYIVTTLYTAITMVGFTCFKCLAQIITRPKRMGVHILLDFIKIQKHVQFTTAKFV